MVTGVRGVTRGYLGLQRDTGIQGVTGGHMSLKAVTRGYRGF